MPKKVENTQPAPEAAPAPAAPAAAPKKKSNTALIIILVVVFLFVVLPMIGIFGAGWFVKKKVEDVANNGNFTLDDGETKITAGSNVTWPTTMPSSVPKFNDGKIEASGSTDGNWSVTISGVTQNEFDSYRSDLTAEGWTMDAENNLGGLVMVSMVKGNYTANLTFSTQEGSLLIGVVKNLTE